MKIKRVFIAIFNSTYEQVNKHARPPPQTGRRPPAIAPAVTGRRAARGHKDAEEDVDDVLLLDVGEGVAVEALDGDLHRHLAHLGVAEAKQDESSALVPEKW